MANVISKWCDLQVTITCLITLLFSWSHEHMAEASVKVSEIFLFSCCQWGTYCASFFFWGRTFLTFFLCNFIQYVFNRRTRCYLPKMSALLLFFKCQKVSQMRYVFALVQTFGPLQCLCNFEYIGLKVLSFKVKFWKEWMHLNIT